MSSSSLSQDSAWSATVAEAATWLALLHGPDRTPATERGLRSWLAESPLHAKAFELATETWNDARASIKRGTRVALILPGDREASRRSASRFKMAAAAALATLAVSGWLVWNLYRQHSGVATGVGERRILVLEDGTQVYLNTATRVVIDYGKSKRHIRLMSGEALFDVAKRAGWPFVVSVGDRDITALGTAFLVRRDDERIAVTLMEGKIAVSPPAGSAIDPARSAPSAITLIPGQRVMLVEQRPPVLDQPELEKLTAWQNGKVHIDNLPLADAITEMNRYSSLQLEARGRVGSSLRLSGVFRIGDSRNFANAVARTHGLALKDEGQRIVLGDSRGSSATE